MNKAPELMTPEEFHKSKGKVGRVSTDAEHAWDIRDALCARLPVNRKAYDEYSNTNSRLANGIGELPVGYVRAGDRYVFYGQEAPVAPEAAEAREPWQMTQAEYGSRVIAAGPDFAGKMGPHRGHVESAIAAGKPVPAAVLADYSDLAAKAEAPAKGAFAPEGGRGQDGVDIKAGQMFRSAAQVLGRLAAGKPKRYSQSERERRRIALAEARKKRWPHK